MDAFAMAAKDISSDLSEEVSLSVKYFGIHTFPKTHAFRVLLSLFPSGFFLPDFSLTL